MFIHLGHFPFCIPQGDPDSTYVRVSLEDAMFLFWKAQKIEFTSSVSYTGTAIRFGPDGEQLEYDVSVDVSANGESSIYDNSAIEERVCKTGGLEIAANAREGNFGEDGVLEISVSFLSRYGIFSTKEYDEILKIDDDIYIRFVVDGFVGEVYSGFDFSNSPSARQDLTKSANILINGNSYSSDINFRKFPIWDLESAVNFSLDITIT